MVCLGYEEIQEYLKKYRSYYFFQNSVFIFVYILFLVFLYYGMDYSLIE